MPDQISVGAWTEWEATKLVPATMLQGSLLDAALKHLEAGLGNRPFLVGGGLTLADVGRCEEDA